MFLTRVAFVGLLGLVAVDSGFGQVQVLALKGKVTFGKSQIHAGQVLQGTGTLRASGRGSYVDIELPGGHVTRLKDGTLTLKKVEPQATLMSLVKGRLFSVIKKLKGRATYQVETAGAVAGVRGTKLFFEEDGSQSYVCVCEGRIKLKKAGTPEKDKGREVRSGKEVFTPKGGDPGKIQPASPDKLEAAETEFKALGFPVDKSQW